MSPVTWTHALAAIFSLIVGVGLGWLLRGAVKEDLNEPPTKKRWYRKLGVSELIGIAVGLLSIVALVSLMITISEQRNVTQCQRAFNELTRDALSERAKAGDLDREVLKLGAASTVTMLDAILDPVRTQDQRRAAVETWREQQATITNKLDEAAKIREDNPLPDAPRC